MKQIFSVIFLLFSICVIQAQTDTLNTKADSIYVPDTSRFHSEFRKKFSLKWHMYPHSPLRATIFSAAFPGLGQIYNGYHTEGNVFRKYWKVPIVYAGVGTCIAFIDFNTRKYKFYRNEFLAYADDDPNTIPTIEADVGQLNKVQEQYHRWMDVSYMCLVGVYLLQVIDANVDAHLFYYDTKSDLSIELHPAVIPSERLHAGIGLTMRF